jgi:hypothetical protein
MSDRTKLMLASLAMMMLPYQVEFLLDVLVLAAMGSMACLSTKSIWRGSNDQFLLTDG